MRKNIQTRTMHRSLRNGPVIKSKGTKQIKNAGNVTNIFSLKLVMNLKEKISIL
tara:strand:- start:949 stop:1110 length:162 start_codon:yes stop_codon:yes gene_type:complete